jgi:uncharacterized protein
MPSNPFWIQTYSGLKIDLMNPNPKAINIIDIARSLSMQCRFAGHCKKFYSVAEHSYHVSRILPEHLALQGLLHDASEAYLTDIPSPLKPMLLNYNTLENNFTDLIFNIFGIPDYEIFEDQIHNADMKILKAETEELVSKPAINNWTDRLPIASVLTRIKCWDPETAEDVFLKRFRELLETRERHVA